MEFFEGSGRFRFTTTLHDALIDIVERFIKHHWASAEYDQGALRLLRRGGERSEATMPARQRAPVLRYWASGPNERNLITTTRSVRALPRSQSGHGH